MALQKRPGGHIVLSKSTLRVRSRGGLPIGVSFPQLNRNRKPKKFELFEILQNFRGRGLRSEPPGGRYGPRQAYSKYKEYSVGAGLWWC